ncbi:hypothetical protein HU200_050670 [Digitaria exilis]|uniref:Uncharacterized protein n=1 Tax=Digitaria exilis TaxID=1010633 RepID=A0A835E5P6_9POAL|nr:hypothetical protein HU200_050670 [Digitaria exilis]
MADLPRNDVLFLPLLVAATTTGRLPPSPWALPVIGHIHRSHRRRACRIGHLPVIALADADAPQPDAARDEARAGEDDGEKRAAGVEDEDLLDREDQLDRLTIKADMFAASSETSSTTLQWGHGRADEEPKSDAQGPGRVEYVTDYLPLLMPRECRSPCRVLGLDVPAWAIDRQGPDLLGQTSRKTSDVDFKGTDFEFIPFGAGRPGSGPRAGLSPVPLRLGASGRGGARRGELDMTEAPGIAHLVLLPTVRVP